MRGHVVSKVLVFLAPSVTPEDIVTAYCLGRMATLTPAHAKRWAGNAGFLAAMGAAGWNCDRPTLLQNSARLTWGDGRSLAAPGQKND